VPILIPLFDFVLSSEGCDYIEEGSDCLNVVLYRLDNVPPSLWFYYPALCYLLISVPSEMLNNAQLPLTPEQTKILYDARENYGQDFCDVFTCVLKNFIQRGFDQIMTEKDFFGVPLVELIFKIYDHFSNISNNGESAMNLSSINGLLICLLENGMGKLDHLFPRIVE
jgi:hypothetical protein